LFSFVSTRRCGNLSCPLYIYILLNLRLSSMFSAELDFSGYSYKFTCSSLGSLSSDTCFLPKQLEM
jgi:hypothetical protein